MEFVSGSGDSTQIGYINRNNQKCHGHRNVPGTDHGAIAYKIECQNCGHIYGANGTDIFQRKCPKCQGGEPGIPF